MLRSTPCLRRSGRRCMGEDRRMRREATATALCLLSALAVACAAPSKAAESGDALLARYRAVLEQLPPLRDVVFQYTESRTGPARTLVEEHQVYRRTDGAERNETIAVNGAQVVPAIVRFVRRPDWPYDVKAFAVTAADYDVLPLGRAVVNGKHAFGYSTVRTTTGDFSVTRLYLDLERALPLRETFTVSGGGCAGTGSIDFAASAGAWLPAVTKVSCTVADTGATFKETITFHDFAFPPSLPPDVFGGLQ
jgi:hypothetical protein